MFAIVMLFVYKAQFFYRYQKMTILENTLVPQNIEGKHTDLKFSTDLKTADEAIRCFQRASKRMLNPSIWHDLCGPLSAKFKLVTEKGMDPHRLAEINDYFRIDIPGPGTKAGSGYDWVKVEAIEDHSFAGAEQESAGLRVRPCRQPGKGQEAVAHFFQNKATSTFIIHRKGNVVSACYHGRNELANTQTDSTTDNIRNAIISSGALSGLSEAQWLSLLKAFLQDEIGG